MVTVRNKFGNKETNLFQENAIENDVCLNVLMEIP